MRNNWLGLRPRQLSRDRNLELSTWLIISVLWRKCHSLNGYSICTLSCASLTILSQKTRAHNLVVFNRNTRSREGGEKKNRGISRSPKTSTWTSSVIKLVNLLFLNTGHHCFSVVKHGTAKGFMGKIEGESAIQVNIICTEYALCNFV